MRSTLSNRIALALLLGAIIWCALAATISSEVPHVVNYQGRLTNTGGDPVPDGDYEITFFIYDDEEGGEPLWGPENPTDVTVTNGLFEWQLGSLEPFTKGLFDDTTRWLSISIGADPEMDPRTKLTSVPFAYHALNADDDGDWTEAAGDIYRTDGNVGIGMSDPRAKLDVAGGIRILRDDDFVEFGEGEGLELFYDPVARVGIIQVFQRFAGYRTLNLAHGRVGIDVMNPGYDLDVGGECHASSFPTSSDSRFKTNVKTVDNALERLTQIRGVTFDWNEKYEALGRSTGHRELGVIAQEVEEIFPELVTTWGDDNYRAVDYGRLTGVLIEAIKELKTENDEVKRELAELRKLIEKE